MTVTIADARYLSQSLQLGSIDDGLAEGVFVVVVDGVLYSCSRRRGVADGHHNVAARGSGAGTWVGCAARVGEDGFDHVCADA